MELPYLGNTSNNIKNINNNIKKNCLKKVQKCLKENVVFKVTCPNCGENYVGKTDRNLVTRLHKQASCEDQPMYQHLSKCEHFAHIIDLLRLPDIDASTTEINNKQHFVNSVLSNFCVLDTCCNWSQFAIFRSIVHQKNCTQKLMMA